MAGDGPGAVALPGLRPGAASGAALWDRPQRRRIFLGIAGNPASGLGGGAPGRTRADPVAGLHPDRQRQSQTADAKAAGGGAVFWRGAGRARYAWPQRGGGRRRIRRGFSDGQTRGPPEGQTGAAGANQSGLGGILQNRPSMKQNAYFGPNSSRPRPKHALLCMLTDNLTTGEGCPWPVKIASSLMV